MIKKKSRNLIKNLQLFLDSIGDGVFIVDKKGNITQTNIAAAEILGLSQNSFQGKFFLEPLGAVDEKGNLVNKKNAALWQSLKRGKKTVNALRQFTTQKNDHIWVSITTTPVLSGGKIGGAIIVFRDITKQKQDEEYHTDFVNVASHNLRSPMANVLWAIEYLVSGEIGSMDKKQKTYIEDIYTKLKEMNSMVNDLLSISRMQNEKIKPELKKNSITETINKVLADLEHYARSQNVTIEVENECDKNDFVSADLGHLRSIIQNLVENAIRYSFPRTTIKLKTENKGKKLLFSCTNEGIGIPKEKQKFIFAKFFRSKNAVSKQASGTGLGLYITKEMVTTNNGRVWFESEPNEETVFYVEFKKP